MFKVVKNLQCLYTEIPSLIYRISQEQQIERSNCQIFCKFSLNVLRKIVEILKTVLKFQDSSPPLSLRFPFFRGWRNDILYVSLGWRN